MATRTAMPSLKPGFEIEPKSPVSRDYRPEGSVIHRVSDGEDWYSVARRYNLPVQDLIYSNFKTNVPREINWYLREYVRCDLPTADRKNWRFSTSARNGGGPRAGVVYIPLNWPAILAAAKKATAELVREWFQMCQLGPASTMVSGSTLTVMPSGLRSLVRQGAAAFVLFEMAMRDAGAPDDLVKQWSRTLLDGLQMFTSTLHDVRPGVFPMLDGPGPFFGPTPAIPFPLLMASAQDGLLKGPNFRLILMTAGVEGAAANRAMRDYARWFEMAFSQFRASAMAVSVLATVHGGMGRPQGMATGHVGFLRLGRMPVV